MKKFRKATSLLLAIMMVVTMFSSITIASANTVVDKFEVVEYSICDAQGNPAELAAGTTVYVKTILERVGDTNNSNSYSATVINAVYAGDEMLAVDGVGKDFPFYGTTQTYVSELVIPAVEKELKLKTLLWDGNGYTSLKPLAVSSDEAVVSGFAVEGVVAEDEGNDTFSVDLPKGSPAEPKVATLANGFVNAVVTYPADGVINVAANGTNYTINYTVPVEVKGELTNVTSTRLAGDGTPQVTQLTEHGVLKTIPEVTDNTKTYAELIGVSSEAEIADVASTAWSNKPTCIMTEIPDMFVGMNYFIWPSSVSGGTNFGYRGEDTVTFTTNKDVDIFFSASDAWKDADAIKILPTGFSFKYLFSANYDAFANTAIKDYPVGTITNWSIGGLLSMPSQAMYKKEIRLAEGETSKTVSVKVTTDNAKGDSWGFNKFFYMFPEDDAYISDASGARNRDGAAYNMDYCGTVKMFPENVTDSTTFKEIWNYDASGDVEKNAMLAISGMAGYIYTEFPEEFEGMKYLAPDDYNSSVYCEQMNVRFTTSKSVRIYYPATSDWHDADATYWGTKTTSTINVGHNPSATYGSQVGSEKTANTSIYTKDIIVPEGETVTVPLKLRATQAVSNAFAFPFIVYEFIDAEEVEETAANVTNVTRWGEDAEGNIVSTVFTVAPQDLIIPEFVQRADGNYYLTAEEVGGAAIWNILAVRPDAYEYKLITAVPDEMVGAKMLMWGSGGASDTWVTSDMNPMIKLTIDKDATLYFDTSDANAEKLGAIRMNETIKYRNSKGYNCSEIFFLTPEQYEGTDTTDLEELHDGRLFKLELKVPAGQSSATFEIPLQFFGAYPYAFIK